MSGNQNHSEIINIFSWHPTLQKLDSYNTLQRNQLHGTMEVTAIPYHTRNWTGDSLPVVTHRLPSGIAPNLFGKRSPCENRTAQLAVGQMKRQTHRMYGAVYSTVVRSTRVLYACCTRATYERAVNRWPIGCNSRNRPDKSSTLYQIGIIYYLGDRSSCFLWWCELRVVSLLMLRRTALRQNIHSLSISAMPWPGVDLSRPPQHPSPFFSSRQSILRSDTCWSGRPGETRGWKQETRHQMVISRPHWPNDALIRVCGVGGGGEVVTWRETPDGVGCHTTDRMLG